MDWIGTITALAGAYLLSFDKSWSRWGWVLYFMSNVAWVIPAGLIQSLQNTFRKDAKHHQIVFVAHRAALPNDDR